MRWGVIAWALAGIVVLLVFGWLAASWLAVVVVPLLLALFPAALLEPAVNWLNRHRVPRPLATLLAMVTALAVVGGVFALIVPEFMAQLTALTDSLTNGANRLNALLERLPVSQAGTTAADLLQQAARRVFGGIGTALQTGLSVLAGLVLLVVALACYLTSGRRIVNTGLTLVPDRRRPAAQELADRVWHTLGSYTRAPFLVRSSPKVIPARHCPSGAGRWPNTRSRAAPAELKGMATLDESPGVRPDRGDDVGHPDGLCDVVDIAEEDCHAGQHEQERDGDPELRDEHLALVATSDRAEYHHRIDERRDEDAPV